MKGFVLGLSVSIAFIIGCISARVIIPPAHANMPTQKWEYFIISTDWDSVINPMNEAGAQGWELASYRSEAGRALAVMKRPRP